MITFCIVLHIFQNRTADALHFPRTVSTANSCDISAAIDPDIGRGGGHAWGTGLLPTLLPGRGRRRRRSRRFWTGRRRERRRRRQHGGRAALVEACSCSPRGTARRMVQTIGITTYTSESSLNNFNISLKEFQPPTNFELRRAPNSAASGTTATTASSAVRSGRS